MFTGGLSTLLVNLNFSITTTTNKNPFSGGGGAAVAGPIAALLMFASIVYSISSSKNKKQSNIIQGETYNLVSTHVADSSVTGLFRSPVDDDQISWKSATDGLTEEDNKELGLEADAKYAEDLQVQEALLASMLASQTTDTASSSTCKGRSSLSSLLKYNKIEECKICLEKHEYWQMFRNTTCSHSFCYDCTRKHATTKIQEHKNVITCPGLNCKSTLDYNMLRLIIPKDTLIKLDELLCESMILESQKLYCPFSDCSVLLINDDSSITKIDCPVCKRSICAVCRVPWHSEFSCKEFGKLNTKMKGKGDEMAVALAKKKKWRKCPSCKFFVEKAEGCVHITCRCKYEFCYNCGAKWSSTHGGCRAKS
uniref:probable E3 ubiquitin-protein ligase RNF217 n=1 Tax=Erigeron canadensis TaxID=72917 RepID=UPI001CB8DAB8|nr:probable E3 ubiquitin-protein ligase RNF217 [Erigeron canadensis]